MIPNDNKERRQYQDENITDGSKGWAFKTPQPEHVQHLSEQAKSCVSQELHAKMFSKDFRKHREALQDITKNVEELKEETKQNLDILLKWATLRLFDTNASTQTKTLSFLHRLFEMLDESDYRLTDYEASIIIPILLQCYACGEALADGISSLLRIIPRVYPSSKVFDMLLKHGLVESKSPRTRAETLEQLGILIRRQGLTVCSTPSTSLPIILQFTTDKVTPVRNAALTVMQQSHLHVGDELWTYLGALSETQRALLQQKLACDSPVRPSSRTAASDDGSGKQKLSPRGSSLATSQTQRERKSSRSPSTVSSTSTSSSSTVSSISSDRAGKKKDISEPASKKATPASKVLSLELDKLDVKSSQKIKTRNGLPLELAPVPVASSLTAPTPSVTRLSSRSAASDNSSTNPTIEEWATSLDVAADTELLVTTCKQVLEKVGENPSFFVGCSDNLIKALAELLDASMKKKDFSPVKSREFKYVINLLFKLLSQAPVAIGLSRDVTKMALYSLMVAFVNPLVQPKGKDGAHTSQA